jgi:hypothetical protein
MTALRRAQVAHLICADALVLAKEIARSADKPTKMIPNPEYDNWVAKDQQVLNYLLSSISREILVSRVHHVHGGGSEGHPGHVHVTVPWPRHQHWMALATAQKGASTIAEYFSRMKGLADDMASARMKLEDEEIAFYILASLDGNFNPVVSAMAAHVEPLSLGEPYTQLVN